MVDEQIEVVDGETEEPTEETPEEVEPETPTEAE